MFHLVHMRTVYVIIVVFSVEESFDFNTAGDDEEQTSSRELHYMYHVHVLSLFLIDCVCVCVYVHACVYMCCVYCVYMRTCKCMYECVYTVQLRCNLTLTRKQFNCTLK